jgi:NitT/TauT family transport system ATP-binding protein
VRAGASRAAHPAVADRSTDGSSASPQPKPLVRVPDIPADDASDGVLPQATRPLLTVRGVSKRYEGKGSRPVFQDLDLDVATGSFLSIVGHSGCGKSTLLRMLAGLEPGTGASGSIRFRDQEVTSPPRRMIYVFQQYEKSIFPWRTAMENVSFGLTHQRGDNLGSRLRQARRYGEERPVARMSKADIRDRCREYLGLVGLSGYEDYYPKQLSGGMQQRVAIARALVCEPDALLMDEPFSAVDALTRASLQQLLLDIYDRLDLTVVFVTHDVDEAVLLSSRVVCLAGGPATVAVDVPIDIAFPRVPGVVRDDPRFLSARDELMHAINHRDAEVVL